VSGSGGEVEVEVEGRYEPDIVGWWIAVRSLEPQIQATGWWPMTKETGFFNHGISLGDQKLAAGTA
jgi:hypothetical protein